MSGLEDVKVGDVLLEIRGAYAGEDRVRRVEVSRTTPTRIMVKSGESYSRSTSYMIGSSGYHRPYLEAWDQARWEVAHAKEKFRLKVDKLSHTHWHRLDPELVAQIHAMLPKPVQKTDTP